MIRHTIFAIGAAIACAHAMASGGGSYDSFVNRSATDIPLNRYQAGTLGIVLPTYSRVYLYAAWRNAALGDAAGKAPNPPGALLAALGSREGGWYDSANVSTTYEPWVELANEFTKVKVDLDAPKLYFLNCPASSYDFAVETLRELTHRPDATPARLEAWIATQRQVFKFCGDDPKAQRQPYSDAKPQALPMPVPLPVSEPLYWRQMQQYQLGAAAFYNQDYATSQRIFTEIGATEGHPLRKWGAYLTMRSQLRAALLPKPDPATTPAQKLAAIQASAEQILRNPALEDLHASTRALARGAKARVTPDARIMELSKLLDDPRADPYFEDHLGDWRVLADQFLSGFAVKERQALVPQLRKSASFVDWIVTVQACRTTSDEAVCKQQPQHAVAQWRQNSAGKSASEQAQARAWLLAAAMLSDTAPGSTMPADVEQAALKVAASAPEYLTVRYALSRHYRTTKQDAKARAIAEGILGNSALARNMSASTRNQFLQERFAVATSPADAAPYLMRTVTIDLDPDTGEVAKRDGDATGGTAAGEAQTVPPALAADSLRWLNQGLATSDLYALGSNAAINPATRSSIAIAAWMRADLLQQTDLAAQAAQLAGRTTPALAPLMQQYLALKTPPERRHWMLVNSVRYGFSPIAGSGIRRGAGTPRGEDELLADLWCKLPAADWQTDVEHAPPLRDTGNGAQRDQELATLSKLKTATGFIGDYVMERAAKVPNDPDLPWLLHMVVMSTRGGCLDADSHKLSKDAFTLLHKRFKYSPWAGKTPYFY
jgi:hypothetical protein